MDELVAIMHLCAAAFVGGPEKQILAQAQYLPAHGFRVEVASFLQDGEGFAFLEEAARRGIDTLHLPSAGPLDLSPARRIAAEIKERRLALVCAHGAKAAFLGYLATRRTGVPLVVWSRGWTGETWRVRRYDLVDRMILRRADLVIAVSRAQADRCRKAGVRPKRLRVVPNAVEGGSGPAAPAADPRAELGLPARCRLVLSVGRLSPEKGHRHLVAAAPAVLAAFPDAFFVVLGEGAERPRLERQIQQLGLGRHFVLAGFRANASRLMVQATLLALPSLTEGLPNAVLEAFAAGLPVVATAVGGVPELVRDGETGWLVQDHARLGGTLVQALGSPEEARRRAQAARSLVSREYSFPVQVARLAAEYRALLKTRGSN